MIDLLFSVGIIIFSALFFISALIFDYCNTRKEILEILRNRKSTERKKRNTIK